MKLGKERRPPQAFPAEYQKGLVKFLNCRIDLKNRVFIPRIETEFWVKKAIKKLRLIEARPRCLPKAGGWREGCSLRVLDIFAGSGCIGIAVLKNIKDSFVDFIDIDKRAIEQIEINLSLNKILKSRYKIYKSNLFEKLQNKKYDFIFANPPYVAKERLGEVEPAVLKYEPKKAFLAGKGGLFFIRGFLKEAKNFLKQNGAIYLEIDPFQKEDIKNILLNEGYKKFKFFKDQFKKYRFVKIC